MDESTSRPGVSYVMPVLNEVGYLEAAVDSILEQQYAGPVEIVLALGPSTDGTAGVVERLLARDERIRVVENPGTDIPIGLNLAIAAARHPVIVRVDAHTQLSAGYTERGVATLERTGAASLGGIMRATGRPGVQAAVARAYNSRFGLGGGAYHGSDAQEGPAESAYMGIMQADALAEVGGYDESLRRGEDWELNLRLRRAGHIVWLDPELVVTYWPRDTLEKLGRQFVATGTWRGELVRRYGGRNPLRFFAPPALVLSIALSLVLLPMLVAGILPLPLAVLASLVFVGPAAYLALLIAAGISTRAPVGEAALFAVVLAVMHLSWGLGFMRGIAFGAGDAVDRSRTES